MKNTRRNFIKKTSIGTASVVMGALSPNFMIGRNILGANDRINCAIAGVRSRGKAHAAAIHLQKNANVIFSCDVDDKIIEEHNIWSKKNIGYVGSLGSKKTHQKRCERLSLLGFNQNDLNKIHGPIGLDIKAKNPAEIAISILGEIIQFRRAN